MEFSFISDSPEATYAWGVQLATGIKSPSVIALYGNLGAGKTMLVKGIAAGSGVALPVSSPTFILINEYALPAGSMLFHVDCYRLGDAVAEAQAIGLTDLYEQGVVLIEWADRIAPLLPEDRLDIVLEDAGPQQRRISLCNRGAAPWPLA